MCNDDRPGYYLKDSQRCAHGLGWEHKRRGLPRTNPFIGTWKEEHYDSGYDNFQKPLKS